MARSIVDRVVDVVAHRHQFYAEAGSAGRDIDALDRAIERIAPAAVDEREVEPRRKAVLNVLREGQKCWNHPDSSTITP